MKTLNIFETFVSLQGESTYSGIPCFFIRLAGCNLRCLYCDTRGAWDDGSGRSIEALVREAEASGCRLIEVTGGEPLIQDGVSDLLRQLAALPGRKVLVETNGSRDISVVPDNVVAVMDVKCPSSGQDKWFDSANLSRLRLFDEVKFVLSDRADYEWAREFIRSSDLSNKCAAVLLSAVHGVLDHSSLAEWMLADMLPARLQIQLHKVLGHR